MYRMSEGQEHVGPGTSTVQRINWTTGQEQELAGLGCASCGGTCGLGLFESLDPTTWGWQEIAIAVFGAWTLISLFSTTTRAVRTVRAYPGERRRKKAARLRLRASELSRA
jgi:hypothetical protein